MTRPIVLGEHGHAAILITSYRLYKQDAIRGERPQTYRIVPDYDYRNMSSAWTLLGEYKNLDDAKACLSNQ